MNATTVLLTFIVVLLIIVWTRELLISRRIDLDGEVCLGGSPAEVVQTITLATAGLANHTVQVVADHMLIITRRVIPWWVVIVAIVFFPVGLLALLIRTTTTVTVVVQDMGQEKVQVTFQGRVSRQLNERLARVWGEAGTRPGISSG